MWWPSLVSLLINSATFGNSNTHSYSRRILLFPTGNSNAPPNESVSIYLDYADPKTSTDWHACAQFALVMSNIQDPSIYVVSRKTTLPYMTQNMINSLYM